VRVVRVLGATRPLPGLVGVRPVRVCACCGRYREGEGWRVELGRRVEWRRSRVEGAVPVCGGCLVGALVRLLRSGRSGLEAGAGGAWLRRVGADGLVVETMGPRARARADALSGWHSETRSPGEVEGVSKPAARGGAGGGLRGGPGPAGIETEKGLEVKHG